MKESFQWRFMDFFFDFSSQGVKVNDKPWESKDQTLPIGSRESFIWIILKTILCLVLDFQGKWLSASLIWSTPPTQDAIVTNLRFYKDSLLNMLCNNPGRGVVPTYWSTKWSPFHANKTNMKPSNPPPEKDEMPEPSGQIVTFHQPRFPWKKGKSLTITTIWGPNRSCEVAS